MAKLHRLPWQTPIPLPTLRLTPSTVEAPLRIASRISPRQLLRDLFGDEFNFAVRDADVDAEEHLRSGSHGHGGYVGD